ncbi:GNAT family N-acetyltransferase [Curtobacterium sp. VKM Ac-2861]|uniref:GNAT family N-acetyltransferase n=1 Tax=Curtobacterium sp. VKM Ac-2861 TaxID=2739016 RepID=UPI00349EAAA1
MAEYRRRVPPPALGRTGSTRATASTARGRRAPHRGLEEWARRYDQTPAPGLLVVERRDTGAAVGYCGLVANSVGVPDEPELAYEFLQVSWNHGYATEASGAVIGAARELGYRHLASTVRDWNTASLLVLGKLGFVDTGQRERDQAHGDSVLLRKVL